MHAPPVPNRMSRGCTRVSLRFWASTPQTLEPEAFLTLKSNLLDSHTQDDLPLQSASFETYNEDHTVVFQVLTKSGFALLLKVSQQRKKKKANKRPPSHPSFPLVLSSHPLTLHSLLFCRLLSCSLIPCHLKKVGIAISDEDLENSSQEFQISTIIPHSSLSGYRVISFDKSDQDVCPSPNSSPSAIR